MSDELQPHSSFVIRHSSFPRWSRGVQTDFPAQATLPELFGAWVAKSPDAVAVIDGETTLSYRELDAMAETVAGRLREAGVGAGARVGVPAVLSATFVASILGVLKVGAAYLPLDEEEPPARREMRRGDCHAVLNGSGTGVERVAPQGAGAPPPRESTQTGRVDISSGRGRPGSLGSPAAGEAPAYILYTSGSTGKPKGVVVPHRAITRLVCATDYLTLGPSDRFALHSNLSFDASTLELWGPLLNGGSLVVTPRETLFSTEALADHLRRHHVTSLWLTTSLFAHLAQQAPAMFGGLRHLLFGGEAADPTAVQRVWEAGRPEHLINGYGPTETTTFAVCHEVRGDEGGRIPIGRPIANTDALVLDAHGEPAEEGELWIGGPGVALGYLREPELTARSFVETRWGRLYRTGDQARWRGDGVLDFLGRADRQIKMRGFRIEPGEVEAAIQRYPGVRQCAVRVRTGAGEPVLAAYIAGEGEAGALRVFLQRELPAQMVPATYAFLEKLPLTANGKLDERALPPAEVVHREPAKTSSYTPLQREIAAAWQHVLGLAGVGLDENFFDLGGSSLSLLRLHAELRGVPGGAALRIVTLFEHPTVRKLAAFLEGGAPAKPANQAAERAARRKQAVQRRNSTGT